MTRLRWVLGGKYDAEAMKLWKEHEKILRVALLSVKKEDYQNFVKWLETKELGTALELIQLEESIPSLRKYAAAASASFKK